jgi:pimeloyl-ACP methyl ester carboxylesterase
VRVHRPEAGVAFVEANGLRFGYFAAGEGPLVLLMHGFPDTPHTWDAVRAAVAAAGFRAVSPFMRGYAPTTIPDHDAYGARDLGEDVVALIEALGERSAILVGHDWGALAVYAAAHLAPERVVRRLATVAIPHPRAIEVTLHNAWRARHFFAFKLPGATARFCRDDFRAVDDLYRRWSPRWSVPAGELEPVKNAFAAPGCAHAALGYYRCLTFKAPAFMGVPIRAPALAFAGLDDLADREVYERARRMFAGEYRIESLPGGHFLHRESPDRFLAALLAFIKAA